MVERVKDPISQAEKSVTTLRSLIEKSREFAQKVSGPNKAEAEEIRHWVLEILRQIPPEVVFSSWTAVDEWRKAGIVESEDQKKLNLLLVDFDPQKRWHWFLTQDGILFWEQETGNGRKVKLGKPADWLRLKDKFIESLERGVWLAKERGGLRALT
jgi:hypothetical protein